MSFLKTLVSIFILCVLIYAMYWVAKNVSYVLFYEDLVLETIREVVKEDALK